MAARRRMDYSMKKSLIVCLLMLMVAFAGHAQGDARPDDRHPGMARIHAAKMAYLTDRLQLTATQSGIFVPVYNEYEQEFMAIRQSFRKKYMNDHPNDDDKMARKHAIDDDLDYQQQIIELKRKYNDRFAKAIAPRQVSDLYQAEREFKQILMRQLKPQGRARGRW